MTINEVLSILFLRGEAPSWVQLSKVGCHQKVPIGLRGHTQLFGEVKFMVIA
jgi:hypothetical protein